MTTTKIYRAQSFDHRMIDESMDGGVCEHFARTRSAALHWLRTEVREALAVRDGADGWSVTPDRRPVEVVIQEITLVPGSRRNLAIACLNRCAWMQREPINETLWLDHNGRIVKSPEVTR